MIKKINKKYLLIIAIILSLIAISAVAFIAIFSKSDTSTPAPSSESSIDTPTEADKQPAKPIESYTGESTVVAGAFSIKIPSGWRASISENPSFLAIMFARPNQLESLRYNINSTPVIDRGGIPPWSGLTEHFFIIIPTPSQAFNPDVHLEVSSQPFQFNDGMIGNHYYVVKHADEAQKWGGLQKDSEWQGRTYVYEKNGKRLEAHLALYPSTSISVPFYEDVIRTLELK